MIQKYKVCGYQEYGTSEAADIFMAYEDTADGQNILFSTQQEGRTEYDTRT